MVKNLATLKLKPLKAYFEKEPSAILAFVFGSHARGLEMEDSDFDVAVFLKGKGGGRIGLDVAGIVEKEVDIVRLNEAPATLVSNVMKTGIPLAIKDRKLYWDLCLKASLEAEDFLDFMEDFRRIYKRSNP